jgi:hypothetical protein
MATKPVDPAQVKTCGMAHNTKKTTPSQTCLLKKLVEGKHCQPWPPVYPPHRFDGFSRFLPTQFAIQILFFCSFSATFLFLHSTFSHPCTAALNPQPVSPPNLLFPFLTKTFVVLRFESQLRSTSNTASPRGKDHTRSRNGVGLKPVCAVRATPGFLSSPAQPVIHSQALAKAAPPSPCPK